MPSTPTSPTTPAWVFTYTPNPPTPATIPTSSPTPVTPSLFVSTTAFFSSLHKAIISPKLNPEQQQLATLQGVKSSLEREIAFRQKAGLSTRELEREQMGRIEEALRNLGGDEC